MCQTCDLTSQLMFSTTAPHTYCTWRETDEIRERRRVPQSLWTFQVVYQTSKLKMKTISCPRMNACLGQAALSCLQPFRLLSSSAALMSPRLLPRAALNPFHLSENSWPVFVLVSLDTNYRWRVSSVHARLRGGSRKSKSASVSGFFGGFSHSTPIYFEPEKGRW